MPRKGWTSFLNLDHPFFQPVWRRVATVAALVLWSGLEFWTGSPFWGTLFLGIGLYVAWHFFMIFGKPK